MRGEDCLYRAVGRLDSYSFQHITLDLAMSSHGQHKLHGQQDDDDNGRQCFILEFWQHGFSYSMSSVIVSNCATIIVAPVVW